MHLYQAGMPLALLTEWLGHADPETTLIGTVKFTVELLESEGAQRV
jgi:hypothetical protein